MANDAVAALLASVRAVLRLHGETPSSDNAKTATRVGELAGFDPAPFLRAVRHVHGAEKLPPDQAAPVLSGYLAAIERLNRYLDQFGAT